MHRSVKALIVLATVFAIIYVLWAIRRYFIKRTIANWAGEGLCRELEPPEAGILLGALPGKIVAAFLVWLEFKGRIAIEADRPLRIRWISGPSESGPERALQDALESGGTEDGFAEVLESLYRQTNRRMDGFSGRTTAKKFRAFLEEKWGSELSGAVEGDGLEAWLVLREAGRDWERIPKDEAGQRVRRAVKLSNHIEQLLFSEEFIFERCAEAEVGFFHYRKDLVPARVTPVAGRTEVRIATAWTRDDEPETNPSDPAAGNPDT